MNYQFFTALAVSLILTACGGSSSNHSGSTTGINHPDTTATPPDTITPPDDSAGGNSNTGTDDYHVELLFDKFQDVGNGYYRIDGGAWREQEEGVTKIDYNDIQDELETVYFCEILAQDIPIYSDEAPDFVFSIPAKIRVTASKFDKAALNAYEAASKAFNYNVAGTGELCSVHNTMAEMQKGITDDTVDYMEFNGTEDYYHYMRLEFPEGYEVLFGYAYGYRGEELNPATYYMNNDGSKYDGSHLVLKSATANLGNPTDWANHRVNILLKDKVTAEPVEFSYEYDPKDASFDGKGKLLQDPIVIAVDPSHSTRSVTPLFASHATDNTMVYGRNSGDTRGFYRTVDDEGNEVAWIPDDGDFGRFFGGHATQWLSDGESNPTSRIFGYYLNDYDNASAVFADLKMENYVTISDAAAAVSVTLPNGSSLPNNQDLSLELYSGLTGKPLYNLNTTAFLHGYTADGMAVEYAYTNRLSPEEPQYTQSIQFVDTNELPNLPAKFKVNDVNYLTLSFSSYNVSSDNGFVGDMYLGDGDTVVNYNTLIMLHE